MSLPTWASASRNDRGRIRELIAGLDGVAVVVASEENGAPKTPGPATSHRLASIGRLALSHAWLLNR
jgi:hypothetical protein